MYGNIFSTAAICKGQSDYRSARTYYIIMIITGFIRRSTQFFKVLLLMVISANSCIRSDMQTNLDLANHDIWELINLNSDQYFGENNCIGTCICMLYRHRT